MQAFGGDGNDYIEGNDGQDVLFGDFGQYDAEVEFLPGQNYIAIMLYGNSSGDDIIYGGNNDDIILGQEVRRLIGHTRRLIM